MARSEFGKDVKVIWRDTQRFMGLPITFTSYEILQKKGSWTKLVTKSGILNRRIDEVLIYRIDDLETSQTIVDSLFGVGTICVYCNDASSEKVYLRNVANHKKVYSLLTDLIQEERNRMNMKVGEFQG